MDKLNYGVIGNCCTAALISDKGSIDWLCFPNFDSPSIFASLLDREKGGYFGFEVSPDYQISQSYVPHTNILSTNFVSEENEYPGGNVILASGTTAGYTEKEDNRFKRMEERICISIRRLTCSIWQTWLRIPPPLQTSWENSPS